MSETGYEMSTENMRYHAECAEELEATNRGDGRIPIRHELLSKFANEFDSLRSELERVREENANYRTVLEKLREEIQDKARESNYHTDKCASFSRTECVCGVDTMSDFCDDLLSIEALLHPTAPKEG